MKISTSGNNLPQDVLPQIIDSSILTIKDLAELFKVNIRTIHNWRKQEVIPTFKIQGKVCMTQTMLHNFILEKGGEL